MRADRLLSMLLLLQTHGRLPAPQLAQRLEVSVRTVLRDVEALSASGVPVFTERGRHGGIALLPGWRTDVVGLTAAEGRALVSAPGQGPEFRSALRKVLASAPAPQRDQLQRAGERVLSEPAGWHRAPVPGPHLAALQEAVFAGSRVVLDYRHSGQDAPRRRTVDPHGLVAKGGIWYLVAAHRGTPRLFRVDRVSGVRATGAPAAAPEAPLAQVWARLRAEVERPRVPPVEVRFRVRGAVADRVLRVVAAQLTGPAEPVGGPDDGWREFTAPFRAVPAATAALLGLGTDVHVLAPPELVADLVTTAREVLGAYGG
ncbi:helix-turn-helix transcriptional regulator [Kineococcus rubinsiae]|uniref:helix-turn-helix transcriptional regulator n=1 Tax=Kineococcus rubinsiae TaxID=2609562 RepID=UPI00143188A2|nr:WYL domain-containing protein [Kineococcus rubinsiae]NIZ91163.1 WYL domain-containing protein [Kineococcus rubinsiae]